jgi:hypothetical protein
MERMTVADARKALERVRKASHALDDIYLLRGDASTERGRDMKDALADMIEQLESDAQTWESEIARSDCPKGLFLNACTLADPCEPHRNPDGSHN